MSLYEHYRPKTFGAVLGQSKAVSQIEGMVKMAKQELDSPYQDVTMTLETFDTDAAHLGATGNPNRVRMAVEIVLDSLSGEWEPNPDASTRGKVHHSGQDAGIYLRRA